MDHTDLSLTVTAGVDMVTGLTVTVDMVVEATILTAATDLEDMDLADMVVDMVRTAMRTDMGLEAMVTETTDMATTDMAPTAMVTENRVMDLVATLALTTGLIVIMITMTLQVMAAITVEVMVRVRHDMAVAVMDLVQDQEILILVHIRRVDQRIDIVPIARREAKNRIPIQGAGAVEIMIENKMDIAIETF